MARGGLQMEVADGVLEGFIKGSEKRDADERKVKEEAKRAVDLKATSTAAKQELNLSSMSMLERLRPARLFCVRESPCPTKDCLRRKRLGKFGQVLIACFISA